MTALVLIYMTDSDDNDSHGQANKRNAKSGQVQPLEALWPQGKSLITV